MSSEARILLVDDEPQILRALAINLKALRYQIETAQSGEEALRKPLPTDRMR
jgi:two-component system KDP operon response regulator KdpE